MQNHVWRFYLILILSLIFNCSFYQSGGYGFHIATFPHLKEFAPGDRGWKYLMEVYVSNPPGFFPDSNIREVRISIIDSINVKEYLLKERYIIKRKNVEDIICWPISDTVYVNLLDSAFYTLSNNGCIPIDDSTKIRLENHTLVQIAYRKDRNRFVRYQLSDKGSPSCIVKYIDNTTLK